MADKASIFKASQVLIETRDSLHKSMNDLMTETKTTDDESLIPKSGYYQSLYAVAYALKEAKSLHPPVESKKPFKDAISTLKSIDEMVSTKCEVVDDTLRCDKDTMRIIGDLSSPSLNLLANEIHDLGMEMLAETGSKYKNCVIAPDIVKSKSLDANMMAMCDGIMDWVTTKITPTVTSDTMDLDGIEMPAQRLDIKMNGHGHTFKTLMDAEGKIRFRLTYQDYKAKRFEAVTYLLKRLQKKHLSSNTPDPDTQIRIESVTPKGLSLTVVGTIHKPEGARFLSRFLMGTKDADFIQTETCRRKMLKKSMERAVNLKDKSEITHEEEKSLISNIIACKSKCGYAIRGSTLKKWYVEEGC